MIELLPNQKALLQALAKSPLSEDFYWTGGTLLAARYLHHRHSLDLDLFSNKVYNDEVLLPLVEKIIKDLSFPKPTFTHRQNRQQFTFDGKEPLRLEFVYYPFPALSRRKKDKELGLKIDTLKDIAANKIFALYERAEAKDIFDLYWICKETKWPLKKLHQWAVKKFQVKIDSIHLAAKILEAASKSARFQLKTYPNFEVTEKEIVQFFTPEIKALGRRLLG